MKVPSRAPEHGSVARVECATPSSPQVLASTGSENSEQGGAYLFSFQACFGSEIVRWCSGSEQQQRAVRRGFESHARLCLPPFFIFVIRLTPRPHESVG